MSGSGRADQTLRAPVLGSRHDSCTRFLPYGDKVSLQLGAPLFLEHWSQTAEKALTAS